ncbi:MAG: LysR family transcriptional regulator [Gammaproteobacteria bacterium]|nr:LysR family transcriptional regulator [Gammaproteobacteria bacterium]
MVVAEEQHFGRAAARLGIEQSPLSRSIRHLEGQLRCSLLVRSARGSQLTVAGAALLSEARAILSHAARLKAHARFLEQGRTQFLRLGVCDSIASPRLSLHLATLRRRCPDLAIEIQSLSGDPVASAIEQERVDALFALGLRDTSTLVRTACWDERLDVVMATSHRLASAATVPLSTLLATDELLIAQPWAAVSDRWLRDTAADAVCPVLRALPTVPALLTAVGLDLGIALVPCGIAASFARTDVKVRRIAGRQRRVPAVMLSRRDATHPAIAILREMARERSISRVRHLTSDPDAPAETLDRSP